MNDGSSCMFPFVIDERMTRCHLCLKLSWVFGCAGPLAEDWVRQSPRFGGIEVPWPERSTPHAKGPASLKPYRDDPYGSQGHLLLLPLLERGDRRWERSIFAVRDLERKGLTLTISTDADLRQKPVRDGLPIIRPNRLD